MKRLLSLLFLFLFCPVLLACGDKNDKEPSEQALPYSQEERRSAESSSDSSWAKELPACSAESAPLLRRTKYDAQGNVLSWTDYTLNTDGRPIKATPHSFNGALSDDDYLITYEYSNGYLIAENDYTPDGEKLLYRRKFDQNGQEIKWIIYDEQGKVSLWHEKTYDERGECVSLLLCREGEKAQLMNQREYDYDENGHISRCRYLNQAGNVIHLYDYNYVLDQQGRIISYRQYDASARLLVEWFRYSYSPEGLLLCQEQLDGGERVLIRREFRYDEQGRLLRELLYSSDGELAIIMENSYQ